VSEEEPDLKLTFFASPSCPSLWSAVVDETKRAKLLERLRAQFKKQGVTVEEDQIIMPWDDAANESKG
jgi:hypothetical protein